MDYRRDLRLVLVCALAIALQGASGCKNSSAPSKAGLSVKERFRIPDANADAVYPVGLGILPDSQTLVAAYSDGCVHLADCKSGKIMGEYTLGELPAEKGPRSWKYHWPISNLAVSPTEPLLAAVDYGGKLLFVDAKIGTTKLSAKRSDDDDIRVLKFSPNGRWLAVVPRGPRPVVEVWDVAGARNLFVHQYSSLFKGAMNVPVYDALFSPDNRWFVICGHGEALILDAEKQVIVARLDGYQIGVLAAAFSPDGKQLVTAHPTSDGLHVWEVGTWNLLKKITPEGKLLASESSMLFTSDGTHLLVRDGATVKDPIHLRIYETASWTVAGNLPIAKHECTHMAISKDGVTLVGNGPRKRYAIVWDVSALGK